MGRPRSKTKARRPNSRPDSPGHTPKRPVGAQLARDSGGSVNEDVGCAGLIASKLAPTGFCGAHEFVSAEDPMCELARDSGSSVIQIWIGYRHREQALLPQDKRGPTQSQFGSQAASGRTLISGTPSLSEVPSGGAKRFWLLSALLQK